MSVAGHAAVIGGLAFGVNFESTSVPLGSPPVAIEATVVDESMIEAEAQRIRDLQADRELAAEAEQKRLKDASDRAAEQEAQLERLKAETVEATRKRKLEADALAAEQAILAKVAKERKAEEALIAKLESDQKAKAEADRKAKEKADRIAEAKAEAERKAKAKAAAEAKAAADRKAAAEAKVKQLENELNASIEAEQRHLNAVRSGQFDKYRAQIQQKIARNWNKPASTPPGLECVLRVKQVPGGTVTEVKIEACDADQVVLRSLEQAVHKSSPLPEPDDPELFDRNLKLTFKPDS